MRTAVFPGSFDPFTIGHKDIADRALRMFDKLVIGIGYNIHKPGIAGMVEDRVKAIQSIYADDMRVEVEAYTGLTVNFAKRHGASFIVRGLREVKDFEYERNLADTNSAISDIETVFLTARPELGFISSSMVRELSANGYDVSKFLPCI
ncbi:MAG: pantetheine-phosphate adenylyltransferase [Muribaculaceae bacterium]|nr:pantetheine-phosphate adenylyltransferase [Muribaculaceae bacterium]MDE6631616.1 pantetheine-phosphate adenylyltransferase [Muribaculaceae bacterium]